ncbi:MAG TPA: DNA polymerase III subunit epsilon [Burkholderiales bacterium]|nr:DNA polymerase III subunit epsilon [Burkholderiales bacterium]
MTRQIILDTETTGLEPNLGHRVIELAAVELLNRRLSGNRFHSYLNPGRDSDTAALQIHGLSTEFLQDKPKFQDIVQEFLGYIGGAELIIHNAAFDEAFLDYELGLLGLKQLKEYCEGIVDTLKIAKQLHPGKKNSLDALCERYQVDNSKRTLHGALLDAELLADIYVAMTRGQESLMMEGEYNAPPRGEAALASVKRELVVIAATPAELQEHMQQLEDIEQASNGNCIWSKLEKAR